MTERKKEDETKQREKGKEHPTKKSIAARLSECANIRRQLQAIGAFTCANNARIVSEAMNRFVRSESAYLPWLIGRLYQK